MLGIVVGFVAEARLGRGLGGEVEAGGGTAAGATAAADRLVARGATALLSFGLAGGLAADLRAGTLVVPETILTRSGEAWAADPAFSLRFGRPAGSMLAADGVLATAASKREAWAATGALAVDIESGAVAAVAASNGLPFAALRAICDPAGRTLPPAALVALDGRGHIRPAALMRSLARHPLQIRALMALGREAALARAALLARVAETGLIG